MASLRQATATLAAAGVASPLFDAQTLAAYVLGCSRMDLILHDTENLPEKFADLVARRAQRVPLQHLLGTAPFGHLELAVGPGVFVPRPETELLGEWAVQWVRARGVDKPRVVDLCTGSGALALYLATLLPDAEVTAVELDPRAAAWTQRNIATLAPQVRLELGDVTSPTVLTELSGSCDLVVSNPPYVPESTQVDPEVRVDPHHAVFSGDSGMDVIEAMLPVLARLLKVGGALGIEHDDSTAAQVRAVLEQAGCFGNIVSHRDFAGRDRYVSAEKICE
ncbi:peptide chain release factor N(5)-glutamine methyltransferase [Corynebacterium sp. H128]|uniref:peptide chain release factor N(5)-glutamine methyltransferase n=1 Tax=unclassified Corynebacterium TaxID=2624378 RepID=UPI0030B1D448